MTALQVQARALGDPTRHRIFRYLADANGPVDVAELTVHFSLNHNAIRQHLAKLVDAGLVLETKAQATGPGRPRLVYDVDPTADSRWGVTGPYERLSLLLAEIVRTGDSPVEVGRRAGRQHRISVPPAADAVSGIVDAMARAGFEPETRDRGDHVDIVLGSCPFQSTALADPDTVCALHLGLAHGLAEGTDAIIDGLIARDPRRAGCRLQIHVEHGCRGRGEIRSAANPDKLVLDQSRKVRP